MWEVRTGRGGEGEEARARWRGRGRGRGGECLPVRRGKDAWGRQCCSSAHPLTEEHPLAAIACDRQWAWHSAGDECPYMANTAIDDNEWAMKAMNSNEWQ